MSTNQQQVQVYQYNLNLISITMKIKFPCKMHIQNNSQLLTKDISSSQNNKFIFNQQITLKQDPDKQHFQLIVHLTTDKGAKYVGGIIKLMYSQLMKSEGERLNIPLVKCLDNQSFCQLRLDQVNTSKVFAKIKPKVKPLASQYHIQYRNKSPMSKIQQPFNAGGARSQFNFPLTSGKNRQWQRKSKQMGGGSFISKRKVVGNNINTNYDEQVSFQGGCNSQINPLQAQVYKQGYNKLKQKYKKQCQLLKTQQSKRILLQNNQNTYKLQIMRIKLKLDQNQKTLLQKSSKLTNLQHEFNLLQKKQFDLNYLRQQSINKDHQIRILQQTIKTLQKDNNELKLLNNNKFISDQQKINDMKQQVYQLKLKFQTRQGELMREIKIKSQIIIKKQQDIISKNQIIQRQRYSVEDLQRINQKKTFQYQKNIQNQKSTLNQKILQQKQKRIKIENQKIKSQDKIKQLNSQVQKSKIHINKIQYDKKILIQTNQTYKQELQDFRNYKQKYSQLSREFTFVSDDKIHLQKQLQKTIHSKQINLTELSKQHTSQLQYYKKINKQLQQRTKQLSSKTIQLESQLQMTKNQLQKSKRSFNNIQKQLNELKNKQKDLKVLIKSKEDQILILQSDLAQNSTNYKSGQQTIRFELDKVIDQLQKSKAQVHSQKIKNSQLNQNNNNLISQIAKYKMKVQFIQQKSQKQISNHNDKTYNLQTQIKDSQNQINYLQQNLNHLKENQKNLLQKVQTYELANMSTNQTVQKLKKQIKILQERFNNSQNQIKSKGLDMKQLTTQKQQIQKRLQQKQTEMSKNKAELNKLLSQKNKHQKIIQMLQNDISKLKQDNSYKIKCILESNKKQQQLYDQIKINKQQYTKLQMKFGSLRKQYEKFRDNLIENINSSFAQLPLGQVNSIGSSNSIGNKRKLNSNSSPLNQSKISVSLNKASQNYNSQIVGLIVSNSKDAKVAINKLIEQNKQLMRQIQRLSQDVNSSNRKALNNQEGLSQQIQQLEEQLANLSSSKQQEQIRLEDQIYSLNSKIRQKQSYIKDQHMTIQQLQFTLSNVKLDLQSTHEQSSKKQIILKKQIMQLKDQSQYQISQITTLQNKIQQMDEQLFNICNQIQSQKDMVNKKQIKINQLQDQKQKIQIQNNDLKKNKKQILQKLSSLQLQFNNQKQLKQKNILLLEEEQNKNKQLKKFIDNLMKQKQHAIKSELQKFQQIINIQSKLIQQQREKQQIKQENQKNKKIIQQFKQQIKKLNKNIKQLELQLNDQKSINSKNSQKLKQKQKQISLKIDQLIKIQDKYKKLQQKLTRQLSEVQSQMDQKYTSHLISQKQNNQKILNLEKQNNRLQVTNEKLKNQITQFQQIIFVNNQKNKQLTDSIKICEQEIIKLKEQKDRLDQDNNDISQQVRQKQERLAQFSNQIYNLQLKLESKHIEMNQKIQIISGQWITKCDLICIQYQQRIDIIQKQKRLFAQNLEEQVNQFKKLSSQKKINDSDLQNIKRDFDQKVKLLNDQKIALLAQKNQQINRINQQNKQNFQKFKQKQTQARKISHQLQISKTTITKLDFKSKQAEDKIKNINKVYQSQIEQLKKKQLNHKVFKEGLVDTIWKAQREVRKTVQYFVKNLLTVVSDQKSSKAIMQLTKALETNIVNSIAIKIEQKQLTSSQQKIE